MCGLLCLHVVLHGAALRTGRGLVVTVRLVPRPSPLPEAVGVLREGGQIQAVPVQRGLHGCGRGDEAEALGFARGFSLSTTRVLIRVWYYQ